MTMSPGIVEFFKSRILHHVRYTPKKSTRFCILGITAVVGVLWLDMHRYPKWMGLKVHIVLEEVMDRAPLELRPKLYMYHIVHGWLCNYSMREILRFLKRYKRIDRGIAP